MLLLSLACIDGSTYQAPEPDSGTADEATAPAVAPTNLIVIGMDTLRTDRVGALSGGDLTPNLDAILGESLLLADHRSCSNWTYGALTCFWGGAYGEDLGFVPHGSGEAPGPAPQDFTTVPRMLHHDLGFTTALVGASPWFGTTWRLSDGFSDKTIESSAFGPDVLDWTFDMAQSLPDDRPWMLQVHLLDPHLPFNAPRDYWEDVDVELVAAYDLETSTGIRDTIDGFDQLGQVQQAEVVKAIDALYDAEIRYTDDLIAELWAELDAMGLLDDALVVFWSDHGEQFYEHDAWTHGQSMHSVETSALGALWAPGLAAQTWTEPTSVIDLLPTALDWMGIERPSFVDGLPIGEADPLRPRYLVQGAGEDTLQGVDVGSARLFYGWREGMSYFETDTDPDEQSDRFAPNDEGVKELITLIRAQEQKLVDLRP